MESFGDNSLKITPSLNRLNLDISLIFSFNDIYNDLDNTKY